MVLKITIEGKPKEIAALFAAERHGTKKPLEVQGKGIFRLVHLNALSKCKRKALLERFFERFRGAEHVDVNQPPGTVRVMKELRITGTDDPIYECRNIGESEIELILTL